MASSFVNERQAERLVYETIPTRLRRFAEEDPDREALVVYSSTKRRESLTRCQLVARSRAFARGLVSRGVERGDRIATCLPNCVEWLVYELGIMTAGAIPVHTYWDTTDMGSSVGRSECRLLILDPGEDGERWEELNKVVEVRGGVVDDANFPFLKTVVCTPGPYEHRGLLASDLMLEGDAEDENFPNINPDDVALMFPTSGSTGIPKYVPHTHFGLINNFLSSCEVFGVLPGDVYYVGRPLAWLAGFPFSFIAAGAKHVTLDIRIITIEENVQFIAQLLKEERCTFAILLPSFVSRLEEGDLHGLTCRTVLLGGQMITEDAVKAALRFTEVVRVIYGSTETLGISSGRYLRDSEYRTGNCGRPIPGTQVKVTDEEGELASVNQIGRIHTRSIFLAQPGWIAMDDLASISSRGEVILEGRIDDKIKKGPRLISPYQVAAEIRKFPGVHDVAIFGVPDEEFGQAVCACVEPRSVEHFDLDELKGFCNSVMAPKQSHERISIEPGHYFVFENFPKASSGKTDLKNLREVVFEKLLKQSSGD